MQQNSQIIGEFEKLIKYLKIKIDQDNDKQDMFRLSQNIKIVNILKKYPKKITSGEELKHIKGIGKNTISRIDEILKTGKLSEIKILNDKESIIIDELTSVFGIGREVAKKLIRDHDVKSLKDLKNKYQKGKIELTHHIIKGLEYYDDILKRIPRDEIIEIDKYLQKITKNMGIDGLEYMICGSYRRQKSDSGDIDVLLTNKNIQTLKQFEKGPNYLRMFVEKLANDNFIVDNLDENYKTKYMGFCKLHDVVRRIDIIYIPYESYYTSVVYFTGSGEFNKKMRTLAIELGYLLNGLGLYIKKTNKRISISSEKDLFDKLGMEYIEPKNRD